MSEFQRSADIQARTGLAPIQPAGGTVLDILGTGGDLATDVQTDGLTVLLLHLVVRGGVDACFKRWVVDGSVGIIDHLRELVDRNSTSEREIRVVIVVAEEKQTAGSNEEQAAAAAAHAAVQGIVHSLTLELGKRVRLNAVSCGTGSRGLRQTLQFLGADDAQFIAGSTFDIRET